MQLCPYTIVVGILIFVIIFLLIFNKKKGMKFDEITISMYLMLLALIFFGASTVIKTGQIKILVHELKLLPISVIGIMILLSYMKFVGKSLELRTKLLLGIFPFITMIVVLTNDNHHWFRRSLDIVEHNGIFYVYPTSGWWYWVFAAYNLVLYIIAVAVIAADFYKTPKIYRKRVGYAIAAGMGAVVINLLSSTGIVTDYGDVGLVAYGAAFSVQYVFLTNSKNRSSVQLIRSIVIRDIESPVVIFDHKDILVDANNSAVSIIGKHIEHFRASLSQGMLSLRGICESLGIELKEGIAEINIGEQFFTVSSKKIYDENKKYSGRIVVLNDISHFKANVTALEYLSTHDQLTGLKNRHALSSMEIKSLPTSIVAINISDMKIINDIYGNEYGDKVIKHVASTLKEICADKYDFARLGGDEFSVIINTSSKADASRFIYELKSSLSKKGVDGYFVQLATGVYTIESETVSLQDGIDSAFNIMRSNKSNAVSDEIYRTIDSALKAKLDSEASESRIMEISLKMAESLQLGRDLREKMRILLLIRDVGLLSVPNELIKSLGNLTNEQWEEYKLHTIKGYGIVRSNAQLASVAESVLYHHERYDGYGYPTGLKGDSIPVLARIAAVAECFVELGLPDKDALEVLRKRKYTQFDPLAVDALGWAIGVDND